MDTPTCDVIRGRFSKRLVRLYTPHLVACHGTFTTNNSEFDLRLTLVFSLQFGENRRMLQALRTLLEEFRVEVRDEEARRRQLQQCYANDKAAWEVKWAQMKCQATAQVRHARGHPVLTHYRYTRL